MTNRAVKEQRKMQALSKKTCSILESDNAFDSLGEHRDPSYLNMMAVSMGAVSAFKDESENPFSLNTGCAEAWEVGYAIAKILEDQDAN